MRRTPYDSELVIENTEYKVSPTSGNVGEILGGKSMIFRITENKSYCRREVFGRFPLADAIPDDESVQPFLADLRGERESFVKRADVREAAARTDLSSG